MIILLRMKIQVKIIYQSIVILTISTVATIIWWRGWIYSGFWGPPPFYSALFSLDGEAAYNAMMIQMFFISAGVCTLIAFTIRKMLMR